MNARATKEAANAELIASLSESINRAQVGASWANDRIAPLMHAIRDLTKVDGMTQGHIATRVRLIGKLAMLGVIATDEMGVDFEVAAEAAEAELAMLKGGAQ